MFASVCLIVLANLQVAVLSHLSLLVGTFVVTGSVRFRRIVVALSPLLALCTRLLGLLWSWLRV